MDVLIFGTENNSSKNRQRIVLSGDDSRERAEISPNGACSGPKEPQVWCFPIFGSYGILFTALRFLETLLSLGRVVVWDC